MLVSAENERNTGPQMGMSLLPCEAISRSAPLIISLTVTALNLPPFFLAMAVKSATGVFIGGAAGPSPLPALPWQTAQYASKLSLPWTELIGCAGARSMVGFSVCACGLATTTMLRLSMARNANPALQNVRLIGNLPRTL